MRSRDGFTLTEVLIVLILVGIIGGFAFAQVGSMLAKTRVQRAASVVAADLKLAHSLAARQRQPIRISIDPAANAMRLRDFATPATIYSQRYFHAEGEYPVETFSADETSVLVYPNGLSEKPMTITVAAGGESRQISMSRAGQVRVSGS
ncbi:MAG TPA: GspH/FimT family pseudopilin [Longimicrobiales bacterium]|nr:GspH/FimT family pseudopilin [Longimicrobiales bacterium]